MKSPYDVIIIGAGAAGMMCAIEAGKRGRRVWLVDHAQKIGEKIRISGGGRCNFTNIHTHPGTFLSNNKHFCKSALSQYTPQDFITLVNKHGIAFHEKKLGQLFCDISAQQIIDMLLRECRDAGVTLQPGTPIDSIDTDNGEYRVYTPRGIFTAPSLVIATGGLSIPKIGASTFGHDIARQFGLRITPTRPALVPLTFQDDMLTYCRGLSGVSVDACVTCGKTTFAEGLLFTHRGLSGPSILQISSYWQEGQDIIINLARDVDALAILKDKRKNFARQEIQTCLADIIPRRLAEGILTRENISGRMADLSDKDLQKIATAVNAWHITPSGTEGYKTAEVTLGGVDTHDLSSQTMESKQHKGLYFIGEVMDITGHLGGFNFQWAWSSGYAAGQCV